MNTSHLPLIVAHRGASEDAPENTLAAFRLAWAQGADAIEGDFRLTRDGHVVCIHDADTARVAGGIRRIVETSPLAELRALDVGRWKGERWRREPIPTLDGVLDELPPEKLLFLEIKAGPAVVPPIKAMLEKQASLFERVIIISFDPAVIEESKRMLPAVRANLLVHFHNEEVARRGRLSADKVAAMALRIGADGVSVADDPLVNEPFVARLRECGLACHVWTVNAAHTARRYIGLGIRSITTDRPGALRAGLARGSA